MVLLPIASECEGIGTLPLQGVFKKTIFSLVKNSLNRTRCTSCVSGFFTVYKKICGLPIKKDTKLSRLGLTEDNF